MQRVCLLLYRHFQTDSTWLTASMDAVIIANATVAATIASNFRIFILYILVYHKIRTHIKKTLVVIWRKRSVAVLYVIPSHSYNTLER